MKRLIGFLLLLSVSCAGFAQSYNPVKTAWGHAGYRGARISGETALNILNFGADSTGQLPADSSIRAALEALLGRPGTIHFPAGHYLFHEQILINRDSIQLEGEGYDRSVLQFNLSGRVENLVQIQGELTNDAAQVTIGLARGAYTFKLSDAATFHPSDWMVLQINDTALMTSSWAYGSYAQIFQIRQINGQNVSCTNPTRFSFTTSDHPVIRKINPRREVSISCLGIERQDATAGQSSNIAFDHAVNCRINGIASANTNFAHVEINHSSNIEVSNSYFHHAFAYGGTGQGYGALLQFGTGECLITANYFEHLRHSMLLQAGANGNVLSYNYSRDPHWDEPPLPDSAAGDLVLHGNYPFLNLAEGNFIQNIVIDDSHGKNGPQNTFFRNRAAGFGIFMNFNPPTDSVQFIANEITNPVTGLNFLQGRGHYLQGNNFLGSFVDNNAPVPDSSLYLGAGQKPPCSASYSAWPVVGRPNGFNTGTIYAKARVEAGMPATCQCTVLPLYAPNPTVIKSSWEVYPNPASSSVVISGASKIKEIVLLDAAGRTMQIVLNPRDRQLFVGQLADGLYFLRITGDGQTVVRRLVKH